MICFHKHVCKLFFRYEKRKQRINEIKKQERERERERGDDTVHGVYKDHYLIYPRTDHLIKCFSDLCRINALFFFSTGSFQ